MKLFNLLFIDVGMLVHSALVTKLRKTKAGNEQQDTSINALTPTDWTKSTTYPVCVFIIVAAHIMEVLHLKTFKSVL